MKFFEILYRHGKKRSSIVVKATNKHEAMKRFQNMEIGVKTSIKEIREPLSHKWQAIVDKHNSPIKKKRADTEKYISILEQLSVMLDAGMPINICLSEAVKSTDDLMLEKIFQNVLNDIEGGNGITNALRPYTLQLGSLSISMFDLGEQSGTLSESIDKLAQILQTIHDNRVKLRKATRYPLFTVIAMAIAFTIVITFVVPQFESLFASMQADLPFPTLVLLWLENAITKYGAYIIVTGIALSGVYSYMYRINKDIALQTDKFLLRVYIVGIVTKYAMLGRFVYIFSVLVKAGIPVVDAIKAAISVVDNLYMKLKFQEISSAIEEGRSLYEGFKSTDFFESMVLQMLKAGEDSGALDKMLNKITIYYNSKYNNIIDSVTEMIEPILIGAIAGFVLVLALGIFLPMWNMAEVMGM